MKSNRNRGIELLTAESPSTSPKRDEQQDSIQVVGKVLLVSDDRLLVSEPAVFSQNTKIIWNQSSQEREDFVYQSSRKNSNSSLNLAASQDSSTDSSSIVAHSKRFTKERRLKDPTNSRRYRKSIDYIDYSDQSPPLYGSIPRYETLKKSKSLRQARAAKSNTSSNEITPINSDIDAELQPLISDLKSIPVDASTKSRSRMKKLVYSLMALLLLILSVAPIIFFVTQPLELSQQLEVTRVLGTPRLFEFTTKLRAKNRNIVPIIINYVSINVLASFTNQDVGRREELLAHATRFQNRTALVFQPGLDTTVLGTFTIEDPKNSFGRIIYMTYPFSLILRGRMYYSLFGELIQYRIPVCTVHRVFSEIDIQSSECTTEQGKDQDDYLVLNSSRSK